jgi:hypothetical protein
METQSHETAICTKVRIDYCGLGCLATIMESLLVLRGRKPGTDGLRGLPTGSFGMKSRERPDMFKKRGCERAEAGKINVRHLAIHPDATKLIVGFMGSRTNRDSVTPLMKDLFELLRRCENNRD